MRIFIGLFNCFYIIFYTNTCKSSQNLLSQYQFPLKLCLMEMALVPSFVSFYYVIFSMDQINKFTWHPFFSFYFIFFQFSLLDFLISDFNYNFCYWNFSVFYKSPPSPFKLFRMLQLLQFYFHHYNSELLAF